MLIQSSSSEGILALVGILPRWWRASGGVSLGGDQGLVQRVRGGRRPQRLPTPPAVSKQTQVGAGRQLA